VGFEALPALNTSNINVSEEHTASIFRVKRKEIY
jgi:hypothetical protein